MSNEARMLRNYLLIALRRFRRHPGYAAINIGGLAVGLAACMLIGLYVQDELSYEDFHENADNIVRVVEDQQSDDGRINRVAVTYGPLAPALKDDIPVIKHAVRVLPYEILVSKNGEQRYQEKHTVFVDSTFFEVFTFPLRQGDPHTVLDDPFSLVLTESAARKYFGNEEPVGQTLSLRDDQGVYSFTVSGVAYDPPSNTHLRFDILASFASMRTLYGSYIEDMENWEHPPLYTYLLLREGTSTAALEAQLPELGRRYMGEALASKRSLHLEPLTSIRLYSGRAADLTPSSDIVYVYLFALIALFILLLACVNFTNLATARAKHRMTEVGMRKALGAHRTQLIRQFLGESVLFVILALAIALVLAQVLIPLFNTVSGKALTANALWSTPILMGLLGLVILVGLLAGGYPALYLSRFQPTHVLRGATGENSATARLHQGLVVFQFAVSLVLIIGAFVINRQLDYVKNKRLGFDKDHVVLVPFRDLDNQFHHASLKQVWERLPGVESVTASSGMPGLEYGLWEEMVWPEQASADSLSMMVLTVDHDYAETYGLDIVSGRDFSDAFSSDASQALLINETAARRLGWDDPVGRKLTVRVWFNRQIEKTGTVVGVVRDFQYHSLHRAYDPIVFHIFPETYYYDYIAARLQPGNMSETLASMERAWDAFNPDRPFEFTFLDEQFDALYRAEERLGRLVGGFSILAVLIACLGLFGLAAYAVETRTKEIGIRKVLGASVPGIVALLSKDFLKLVLIAFVIAAPIAYLAMRRWLENFAYHIDLGVGVFLLAGIMAVVIALLTVSYQAVRAALADPVKSLRYE